jgi:hypothetical protein
MDELKGFSTISSRLQLSLDGHGQNSIGCRGEKIYELAFAGFHNKRQKRL